MPMRLCIAYPRTCTSWNWFGPICLNPAPAISEFSVLENLVSVSADMRFVKKYTPLDFQAKNFAPLISLNINSLGYENEWKWRNLHRWHKIYTATGSDGSDKSHLWVSVSVSVNFFSLSHCDCLVQLFFCSCLTTWREAVKNYLADLFRWGGTHHSSRVEKDKAHVWSRLRVARFS